MKSEAKAAVPVLLRPSTVAARLDCKVGTVYGLVRRGALRKVYIGDDMRIPEDSLAEFISTLPTKSTAPPRGQGRKPKPKTEPIATA